MSLYWVVSMCLYWPNHLSLMSWNSIFTLIPVVGALWQTRSAHQKKKNWHKLNKRLWKEIERKQKKWIKRTCLHWHIDFEVEKTYSGWTGWAEANNKEDRRMNHLHLFLLMMSRHYTSAVMTLWESFFTRVHWYRYICSLVQIEEK